MENINGGSNGLYRFQQQQGLVAGNLADRGGQIGYRRPDLLMIGKRSLAEFQSASQSNYFHPQQQQHLFMRSMKQRTGGFQNHTLSPISPLPPSIDLSSQDQSLLSSVSSLSTASSARHGVPLYPHHNNQIQQQPNFKPNNPGPNLNPGSGNRSKMMTTLQELEKQLLFDDDADDRIGGGENDAVSGITHNEWSQTFQDLISPNSAAATANNIISPSPTSSSSSCSSSKTPPAPTPQPAPSCKPSEMISEAAAGIADGKSDEIAETLSRLCQVASPTGEPEQRLAFYMLHALRCRVSPEENPAPVGEMYGSDHILSLHALYDLSPCFKFALLSSNLLILEAIASTMQDKNGVNPKVVHIVDFDVGHGRQYTNLLRALVERASHTLPNGPPLELKITAVETELRNDKEASSKRLEGVRESLMRIVAEKGGGARFTLRFNSVARSVDDLTRESIGCGPDETLVANFAFRLHRVPDESVSVDNLRDELLRRVKAMGPRVVTLSEQELSANTAPFTSRVSECTAYYGALMESLEVARESPDRARVEEAVGRKMANAVACEGRERVERCEVFGKWRARMGMAGFKIKPVGQGVAESMRANLTNPGRGGNPNFTVKDENGGVCFGWMGRTLTVASAWR
nr:GRAS transcription factor 11 [Rheum palmatum]